MPVEPITYILFWILIGAVVIFYRQIYNFVILALWNKDFVVVHIRKTATRKHEVWHAIPNAKDNFFTAVGLFKKRSYDLDPAKANFDFKGRKHYIFNEEDFMPMKFRKVWHGLKKISESDTENYHPKEKEIMPLDREVIYVFNGRVYFKADDQAVPLALDPRTDDDYIIGSKRVNRGTNAKQMWIFSEKPSPFVLILLAGLSIVTIIVVLYGVSEYQKLAPLVQVIYERTIIGNNSMVISPK